MIPPLRDYQSASIELLREGIRDGHPRQILCAPTGSGKTLVGAYLIAEAAAKGSKAAFVCDRVALVNQTSKVFTEFGIPHGVAQGQNTFGRSLPVQVCSAQTIEARGFWPDLDLVIVDEAHTQRKATLKFIKAIGKPVIGLTATPFSRGLGATYSRVVNVTTTDKLIADKWLAPLKVYAAQEIDMKGAKTNGGEWLASEVERRGVRIVGDIVAEWEAKTGKHFGKPVKTIVFSATVDHGEELCRAFQEAGHDFRQVSYKDGNDESRAALIEAFRRGEVMGLVSCEALAKDFDVPDILCLAEGSRVLTEKRGLVPIEKISKCDRLWDGVEWVSHGGAVCRGEQNVIEYEGLAATPGHLVKTAEQIWTPFWDAATQQIPIVQTGIGGIAIPECAGLFSRGRVEGEAAKAPSVCSDRVHGLQEALVSLLVLASTRFMAWLCGLSPQVSCSGLARESLQDGASQVYQAEPRSLRRLRWKRNPVQLRESAQGRRMDSRESWCPGTRPQHADRPDRQRRSLRTGKPSLGEKACAGKQHETGGVGRSNAQIPPGAPEDSLCGQNSAESVLYGADSAANHRAVSQAFRQAKRRVWDILNAGPRNRFTCEGLLVHNCGIAARPYRRSLAAHIQQIGRVMRPAPNKDFALWLDHAGNYLGFLEETLDFFAQGVNELDDGERGRVVRKRFSNGEAPKCRRCGYVWGEGEETDLCPSCGLERGRSRSRVAVAPGRMEQVEGARALERDWASDKRFVWEHIQRIAVERKPANPGAARKFALAQYRNWFDEWPRGDFYFIRGPVDSRVERRVQRQLNKWRRQQYAIQKSIEARDPA